MSSFQHEKPPARINLFLDVKKGDALVREELPLRMLVLGDFGGKDRESDLVDREVTNINKDNFQDVMKTAEIKKELVVKDQLSGEEDADIKVSLNFENMKSFDPEEVAKQIPQLDKLLAARNLLQDLKNRVITTGDFRKQLETIIKDKDALDKLADELRKIVPGEENNEG